VSCKDIAAGPFLSKQGFLKLGHVGWEAVDCAVRNPTNSLSLSQISRFMSVRNQAAQFSACPMRLLTLRVQISAYRSVETSVPSFSELESGMSRMFEGC
jgi:hypothetical protein